MDEKRNTMWAYIITGALFLITLMYASADVYYMYMAVYIWFGFTNEHVEGGPGAVPGDKRVAHVHQVTTWPEFIELDSQRYVTAGVEPQAGLWPYRCPDPR